MAHAVTQTRIYLNGLRMVSVSMEADVKKLLQQKTEIEKVLATLSRNSEPEKLMKQTITAIEDEIKLLADKISANDCKQESLGAKITSLFKDAQNEL